MHRNDFHRPSRVVAILAAALLLTALAASASDPGGVRATYLANEGFLLESGEHKVLVDALFGDGLKEYPKVPVDLRRELESASGRFAGVDVVLATHMHRDHFDADAVARFLRAAPEARFVSTRQSVEALLEVAPSLKGRAHGYWPDEGEQAELKLGAVNLTVLRLHHGRERRPEIENLGFVVRLGGLRLLHIGDTEAVEADFEPYADVLKGVDVAFLPSWFYVASAHKPIVADLGHSRLVAMHLGAETAPSDYFYPVKSRDGLVHHLETTYSGIWVPTAAGAASNFNPAAPSTPDQR